MFLNIPGNKVYLFICEKLGEKKLINNVIVRDPFDPEVDSVNLKIYHKNKLDQSDMKSIVGTSLYKRGW